MTPSEKPTAAQMIVGKEGEDCAVAYLRKIGYTVVARNVRLNKDEIDIIAFDPVDSVYVFAEVKTRTRMDLDYRPELNFTYKKRGFMRRAARRWMTQFTEEIGYRMDVVFIMDGKVVDHYIEVKWV
jgi:putative endonuclease